MICYSILDMLIYFIIFVLISLIYKFLIMKNYNKITSILLIMIISFLLFFFKLHIGSSKKINEEKV